jgi:uncharacterized membrane protein
MIGHLRATAARRQSDERGAVAMMIAVCMVLLLVVASFAIDLGLQRVLRRDLQALADVAALDLSRAIPGKTVTELNAAAPAIVERVIDRNSDTLGDGDGPADNPQVTFAYGTASQGADGSTVFAPGAPGSFPNAVEVRATNEIGFVFRQGSGGAARSAIAMVEGGACFGIGSYAAQLDASASPLLGPLLSALGSDISLTVLNYEGLAGAEVDLVSLLGVKVDGVTLEELVNGDELISLGDFYAATASVLAPGQTAALTALQVISASVDELDVEVPIADLLSISTGGASGLDAALNVLDLVTAGATAASGANGLAIPQLGVDLGPIADVTSSLSVIEPPKVGCGRKNDIGASGQSSAVRLVLDATALDIKLGILNTKVTLSGSVDVASATGQLTDIRCDPAGITVNVKDGLIDVDLTLEVSIDAIFGILPAVTGPIRITGKTTSSGDAVINIEDESDYDEPFTVANSNNGLPELAVDTSGLEALGQPIGKVVGGLVLNPLLSTIVNPLIQGLDDSLLTPLLRSLGLDLSGADVFAMRAPTCENATLRG